MASGSASPANEVEAWLPELPDEDKDIPEYDVLHYWVFSYGFRAGKRISAQTLKEDNMANSRYYQAFVAGFAMGKDQMTRDSTPSTVDNSQT